MELKVQNQVSLLEPWYQFILRINQEQVGRAINDIEKMGGKFEIGESSANIVTITGQAPVAQMQDYATEVRNYSHGRGQLECLFTGYQECKNSGEVIADANYDPFLILTIRLILFFVLMVQGIPSYGMRYSIMLNIRI